MPFWPFSSDLQQQQGVFVQSAAAHRIFSPHSDRCVNSSGVDHCNLGNTQLNAKWAKCGDPRSANYHPTIKAEPHALHFLTSPPSSSRPSAVIATVTTVSVCFSISAKLEAETSGSKGPIDIQGVNSLHLEA